MTDKPPNPPAFPHPSGAQGCDGMTLRDWFAGKALAGDMAAQNEFVGVVLPTASDESLLNQVRLYYRLADAMLIAREEQPK